MTQTSTASDFDRDRIHAALEGNADAVHALVKTLTPVVQARVARALGRRSESRGRDVRQEVADFTQDVFVSLFTDDGKALRAWEPTRGLSFLNFVGLLAERRVSAILRIKRRAPWSEEPTADTLDTMQASPERGPDTRAASSELLHRLFERLQESLSAKGLELFYRLYVDEQAVEVVCEQTGLNAAAVYQWRTRLGEAARKALAEIQADPISAAVSGVPTPASLPTSPHRSKS